MVGNQGKWNKGKKGLQHHSEEVKKKIGEASKKIALEQISRGERKGLFQKGHKSYGGNHTNHSSTIGLLGESNPNYKHGKFMGRIRKFREEIRKRDNYVCQECFISQKQLKKSLDVHHIDFDKKNNNPNNLISLCHVCHAKTNFNRPEWTNYFNIIVTGISSSMTPCLPSKKGQVGKLNLRRQKQK